MVAGALQLATRAFVRSLVALATRYTVTVEVNRDSSSAQLLAGLVHVATCRLVRTSPCQDPFSHAWTPQGRSDSFSDILGSHAQPLGVQKFQPIFLVFTSNHHPHSEVALE